METSAKGGVNIKALFRKLARCVPRVQVPVITWPCIYECASPRALIASKMSCLLLVLTSAFAASSSSPPPPPHPRLLLLIPAPSPPARCSAASSKNPPLKCGRPLQARHTVSLYNPFLLMFYSNCSRQGRGGADWRWRRGSGGCRFMWLLMEL